MARDLIYEVKGLLPEKVILSIEKELSISEDIDQEVDRAAAVFGYYAVLAEKAETRYYKLKFACEVWEAETEHAVNQEREYQEKKPLAEKKLTAMVRSRPKYRSYQLKLIEIGEQKRVLKVLAKAFEKRADMIQTKSSNRRSER